MNYIPVIGLEIHVELNTKSKMFCSCKSEPFKSEPNINVCPVCLGLPGSLPVMNKKAVEWTVVAGLALNCKIAKFSKWDRKNYFYPDLPKGYQISQYDLPLASDGYVEVGDSRVGITRIHLEEDTGKLMHPEGVSYSLVDYNRAGVPLMELVTEPDIKSGKEAKEVAEKLQLVWRALGISNADMEKGEMRVEVNISLKEDTESARYGTKVEIKNLNSFRVVEKAIDYEIGRQEEILNNGDKVIQETRGWNEASAETFSQRTKETAEDYRYFPEPDLPPVEVDHDWLESIRKQVPELPHSRRDRHVEEFGLEKSTAHSLMIKPGLADYFEQVMAAGNNLAAGKIANWLVHEAINWKAIKPQNVAELMTLLDNGTLSGTMAKDVLRKMEESGKSPAEIIEIIGLRPIAEKDELNAIVDNVLKSNQGAIKDYCQGKQTAVTFLIGQVMRETRGQADPILTKSLIEDGLKVYKSEGKDDERSD